MRSFVLLLCALLFTGCGPGEEGPAGPQGPKGEPGLSVNDVIEYQCVGGADIAGGRVALVHLVYLFPDGGVMTQCMLADGALGVGMYQLHRSSTQEAATANCGLFYDVDTASAGAWMFDINSARTASTVTYRDQSSTRNNSTYTIPCTRYAP